MTMKTANEPDERAPTATPPAHMSILVLVVAVLMLTTGCSSFSRLSSGGYAQGSKIYGGPADIVVLTPDGGYDVFDANTCVKKRHVGNPYRYSSDDRMQQVN
jgi:hypothetical protein